MRAAGRGLADCARLLLDHGAVAGARNDERLNAIILAAFRGAREVIRVLREGGATVGIVEAAALGESGLLAEMLNGQSGLNADSVGLCVEIRRE